MQRYILRRLLFSIPVLLLTSVIVFGLLHCLIPMAAIVLLAPLQALNPRLVEAAKVLGAPTWKAHATITLPLSARGLLAAFMLCFTFSISAFVIPMVLGKGRVLFVSNLIYSRFKGAIAPQNPWEATSLEWTIPSPPPFDNFGGKLPVVYHDPYQYGVESSTGDYVMQDSPEQIQSVRDEA